jgi:FtsP/CotA-like multicopper oxidase with cupredoxin domain
MSGTRRKFFQDAALFGAGLFGLTSQLRAQQTSGNPLTRKHISNVSSLNSPTAASPPVLTPDVPDLPHEMDGGVKVFHLTAEPVKQEIVPGRVADLWGYNGSAPGPTIQVTSGDRVRIIVDNHLPEATSMHWHGFEIPIDMDG